MYGGGVALRVADVDEGRSALEDAGVEFSMDTFDSGVCHGAPFSDPDGNPVQLHRRYAPSEPWEPPETEVERTDFVGVNVTDRARAGDFYGGVLGLERNALSSDEWPEFVTSNVGFILSTPEQKNETGFSPKHSIAFRVSDVAESMDRLRERGVRFEFPDVYDSGVCHMAFFRDPDGNELILHHRYAPYPDGSDP